MKGNKTLISLYPGQKKKARDNLNETPQEGDPGVQRASVEDNVQFK